MVGAKGTSGSGPSWVQVADAEQTWILESRRKRGGPGKDAEFLGLALSGGGIRSATFNLGVMQGMAKLGLLREFDYLSTVSGGGFIGSWYMSWLRHSSYPAPPQDDASEEDREAWVAKAPQPCRDFEKLITPADRSATSGVEPRVLAHLRQYSSYITPRRGFFRADMWTVIATYLTNLIPNLLALSLQLLVLLALVRHMGLLSDWLSNKREIALVGGLTCVLLGGVVASSRLPGWLAVLALATSSLFLTPWLWNQVRFHDALSTILYGAAFYLVFWLLTEVLIRAGKPGAEFKLGRFFLGALSVSVAGGVAGGLAHALVAVAARANGAVPGPALLTLGPVIIAITFLVAVALHIGVHGRAYQSLQNESWYYLIASLLLLALTWAFLQAVVHFSPYVLSQVKGWVAGLSWAAVSTLGVALTRTRLDTRLVRTITTIAPYVFIIGLFLLLGFALAKAADAIAAGDFVPLLAAVGVALLVAIRVDANLLSMHYFYRNRLVRAYQGASNDGEASSVPLTPFRYSDNFPMHELATVGGAPAGPYWLVNTALNLNATADLSRQDRQAHSFTIAPKHSGFRLPPRKGASVPGKFAETNTCMGNSPPPLTVGTAVAISGAAASPNMGYRTGPATRFLMALFNVRLGWWMGNPDIPRAWGRPGPRIGSLYLFKELLGVTSENDDFIYLSDGGHFENLGIYELVRRRCQYIVVCDAGQDARFRFDDLGRAIRNIRTDFGYDVKIDLEQLRRQEDGSSTWSCAVGSIHYEHVHPDATPGILVYIKPTLTGDEPADVQEYAAKHAAFPHEPTSDQSFDEAQFESYRRLGYHIALKVFSIAGLRSDSRPLDRERYFVEVADFWRAGSRRIETHFSRHGESLRTILEDIRQGDMLRGLSRQILPEWEESLEQIRQRGDQPGWLLEEEPMRACFYTSSAMIAFMENVYIDLGLETDHAHPDNNGWMNLFRRWSRSMVFRLTWAVTKGTHGSRFQHFCSKRLYLPGGAVRTRFLDRRTVKGLEKKDLDRLYEDNHALAVGGSLHLHRVEAVVVNDDAPAGPDGRLESVVFPVGLAVTTSSGQLGYIRIRRHLRGMGLARSAIQDLRRRGVVWRVEPAGTELHMYVTVSGNFAARLLRSIWRMDTLVYTVKEDGRYHRHGCPLRVSQPYETRGERPMKEVTIGAGAGALLPCSLCLVAPVVYAGVCAGEGESSTADVPLHVFPDCSELADAGRVMEIENGPGVDRAASQCVVCEKRLPYEPCPPTEAPSGPSGSGVDISEDAPASDEQPPPPA